jgi:hypothetical protein
LGAGQPVWIKSTADGQTVTLTQSPEVRCFEMSEIMFLQVRDPVKEAEAQKKWMREMKEDAVRAKKATEKGALALDRLLTLTETRDSGQIPRIASFIGACWNGHRHFDLFDLRMVDLKISDDMIAVIDALRWKRKDINHMFPDANIRIVNVLERWGMYGEDQTGQAIV